MGAIRAVIFDVDGTLVDSNDQHARAWVEALAEYGYKVPFETVRPLIGMGGDKVLPILIGISSEEPKGKKIAERRDAIFADKYLPQVRPLPGARDLLLRLKAGGLKLGVASSSAKDLLKRLLNIVGAPDVWASSPRRARYGMRDSLRRVNRRATSTASSSNAHGTR